MGFLCWVLEEHQELSDEGVKAYDANRELIEQVEKTIMNRSYKMVVLLAMLERGEERWMEPITAEEVATFFYEYLHAEKYRELKDAQTAELKGPFDAVKVERLLKKMPFSKMGSHLHLMVTCYQSKIKHQNGNYLTS